MKIQVLRFAGRLDVVDERIEVKDDGDLSNKKARELPLVEMGRTEGGAGFGGRVNFEMSIKYLSGDIK